MIGGYKPGLTSVIIPSRNNRFLQKTVDDLLNKSRGEIEIIVVLDGYWPKLMIEDDQRVIVLHHGGQHQNYGMRASINTGVSVARGEFIMKVDEHCAFDEGFDIKLAADCKDDWVVTPRMYSIGDDDKWTRAEEWKPLTDSGYLVYPFPDTGLEWRVWKERNQQHCDILIDDCMHFSGSCYFMKHKHWNKLGNLDDENYGSFHYESLEICLKTWLGGGRVVNNKKTWYAHRHRPAKEGRGFGFCNRQTREIYDGKDKAKKYAVDYWVNNKWPDRVHDFEWLIEKFWPVPGWPDDWRQRLEIDKKQKDGLLDVVAV